ncbi:DUF2157 domain-containing protein [candidate division KSB1 bacterium]|nr:DUF2157 domain-containing protein [candidate division KSB1 bacterium]
MEKNKTGFIDWLKKEIVDWKYEGWVSARGGTKILAHYDVSETLDKQRNPAYSKNWLILIGILLLGLGVLFGSGSEDQLFSRPIMAILFFAGLIAAYGMGFYFTFIRRETPLIGELITVAAAFLYGYALLALNSLYNIQAHISTLFLLWAIGIFVLAFILKSEYLLCASILGFTGWSATLSAHILTPNYIYLAVMLIVLIPMVYWQKSVLALLFATIGLSVWIGMALNAYSSSAQIFLPVIFVLWSILLYQLAYLHRKMDQFKHFYLPLKVTAILLLFVALSFLALRSLGLTQARFFTDSQAWFYGEGLPVLIFAIVIALAIIAVAILSLAKKQKELSMLMVETWLLDLIGVIMFVYLLFPEAIPDELKKSLLTDYFLLYTMIFNIALFLFIAIIIYLGIHTKTAWLLNLGIAFGALTSLARYFDSFLPTLPRNTFLFIGGAALVILGLCIKKK